jgi:hypothetical protein
VVTLRQTDGGNYDVLLGASDATVDEPRGGRRDRGRGRGSPETAAAPRTTQVSEPARRERQPAAAAASEPEATQAATQATPAARNVPSPAADQAAAASTGGARPAGGTAAQKAIGFRRGSRGRAAPSGPPPLLEGQTARVGSAAAASTATRGGGAATDGGTEEAQQGRRARKSPAKKAAAKKGARKTAAKSSAARGPAKAAKTGAGSTRKAAAGLSDQSARVDAAELGLPTDAGEIANYIKAYKGVGPKSVQSLIGRFGAARVFDALETKPEAVRDLLGARADRVLESWSEDVAARREGATSAPDGAAGATEGAGGAAKKSRTRRGGRRGRKGQPAGK